MPGLVACGDEEHGWEGGEGEPLDGFDDVDDGAAGTDADVGCGWGEVVFDGEVGGRAFGGFDGVH